MINHENILKTPQKNNDKNFHTYNISTLKQKNHHNHIIFTQFKNLKKTILLKDSSFKVRNYKNNENIKNILKNEYKSKFNRINKTTSKRSI